MLGQPPELDFDPGYDPIYEELGPVLPSETLRSFGPGPIEYTFTGDSVVGPVSYTFAGDPEETVLPTVVQPEEPEDRTGLYIGIAVGALVLGGAIWYLR